MFSFLSHRSSLDFLATLSHSLARSGKDGSLEIDIQEALAVFTRFGGIQAQKMMEEIYHQFTTKAAQSRKMELAKMRQLAEGKVYTGRQAKKLGLVDKVGTLHDAIVAAKEAAGLPADKKIEMLILPKPKSFLEQLLSRQSLETKARNAYLQTLAPDWVNALADLKIIQHLFRQPVNTMLPYRVMIR